MHTLKLKLLPNYAQKEFLDKSFFFAYKMYVSLCKYARKQLRLLSKNNKYKYLKHLYKIYKNLDDKYKLKEISTEINTIVKFYKVSSSDLEKYIKILQHKYKYFISSHQAQKIAKFVSNSIDDYLYGSSFFYKFFNNN